MNELIIELNNLTKKYKNLTAVNNLNLNVYRGDVFGFLGPNGAGKSTTIRMMLSLIKPDSGEIKIFGKSLFQCRNEILRKVGAIIEKPDFYLYLSAFKNLEIFGKVSGCSTEKRRIMEILELVGLEKRADSKVKTFSHGMKQRLGLAQALLHNPELIILDEPTTGLDPQGIKEIRELIINLSQEKGKTIFLSSHILNEIEIICNRMIILNKGESQVEGFVHELLSSDKVLVSFNVDNKELALNLIRSNEWHNYLKQQENNKLYFEVHPDRIPELNKYLVNNSVGVKEIIANKSLEDYFLKITQEAQ